MTELNFNSLLKQFQDTMNKPSERLPTWAHIVGGFLTKDPFFGKKFEASGEQNRQQKMEDMLKMMTVAMKLKSFRPVSEMMSDEMAPKEGFYETPEGEEQTPFKFPQPTGKMKFDPSKMTQGDLPVAKQYMDMFGPKAEEEYTLGEGQTRFRGKEQIAAGVPKQRKVETLTVDWTNPETGETETLHMSPEQYEQWRGGEEPLGQGEVRETDLPISQPQKDIWTRPSETKRPPGQRGKVTREKEKEEKEYAPMNFILPNRKIALSYDRGKSYVGDDGRVHAMPPGSLKMPMGATMEEVLGGRAREGATEKLGGQESVQLTPDMTKQARIGTGPYAGLKAFVDNYFGGIGIDKIFGQEGFFKNTMEARQQLRMFRHQAIDAFANNPRLPVWEQEKIYALLPDPDKFMVNPATEAAKFKTLRNNLTQRKEQINKVIATDRAITSKEIQELRGIELQVDRILDFIGEPEGKSNVLSQEDMDIIRRNLPKR